MNTISLKEIKARAEQGDESAVIVLDMVATSRGPITQEDLAAWYRLAPAAAEFARRGKRQAAAAQARRAKRVKAVAPIVARLRAAGIDVDDEYSAVAPLIPTLTVK